MPLAMPSELRGALVDALPHFARDRAGAAGSYAAALRDVVREAQTAPPEFIALVERLRADPALLAFGGGYEVGPGCATTMSHEFLAFWLLGRATEVGVDQAIQDLDDYLGSSPRFLTASLSQLAACSSTRGVC